MKVPLTLVWLAALFVFGSCIQNAKTTEETIAVIKKDPEFLRYLEDKNQLLYGVAYDQWNLRPGNIEALEQDSTTLLQRSDLSNLYSKHGFSKQFTDLVEAISASSYNLKKKYQLYKFSGVWGALNKTMYAALVVDEKRMNNAWGVREPIIKDADCQQEKLPLCKKNWDKLKEMAVQQFWSNIGEYCRAASAHKNQENVSSAKSSMDCRLNVVRHFLEKIQLSADIHNRCLKMVNCD